jgi:hypothetical protein
MGLRTLLILIAVSLHLATPQNAGAATPQSGYIEAKQFADRLELQIDHPESGIGNLYIRQFGIVEGPIRLAPGENRYTYRILSQDLPLANRTVEVAQYTSTGLQLDYLECEVVEPWIRPNEPALALTKDDIRTLVKRYNLEQRASTVLGRIVTEMDDELLVALQIPDVGGTWINDYVVPGP